MSSIIRIKRSQVSGNPAVLGAGELAYSALPDNGSNGGDRLYIGMGTETAGNAANHVVIGGKYFTDKLDHTPGVLTANSAIIVDGDSKIDQLNVDNIRLDGNTISTQNTNGDLSLTPNGTGKTIAYNLYVDPSTSLAQYIQQQTGGAVTAGLGIDVDYNAGAGTTTISAELASASNAGIASFDSTDFSVTGTGENLVTLNVERIEDIVGAMVSGTGATQNGIAVGYDDTNGKLTFDVNDPTIAIAGDVSGSATMTDLGNTTINVALATVNSNVGTFGSATQIPVVTVNGKGLVTAVSTASISTSLAIAGNTGTDTVTLGSDTLTFTGAAPISVAVTDNTVTISAADATTSSKGVASFSSTSFAVTAGEVTVKTGGISNAQLANSSVTIGSTNVALGATSTSLAGLTELTVDNLNINGNTITATNANGNIVLVPDGTGNVDVSGKKIVGLADPTNPQDAATKNYVDNQVTGLTWKNSVHLLAATNVSLTGSTATLVIDGHAALDIADVGYRLLLIGQTTATENGIYVYNDNGTSYTLTRAADADTFGELIGAAVFVKEGVTYANTGWVQSEHYLTSFAGQDWVQFSGAGAYAAGAGLGQSGTEFFVKVAAVGGIEIVDDALQLKSTVAGDGLTYTDGVVNVVGTTDRIAVTANAVDIASTYAGQASITTVGTIATGTWNATTIGVVYGGTGLTSYAAGDLIYASGATTLAKLNAGTTGQVLQVNSSGLPVWGDIDGGTY